MLEYTLPKMRALRFLQWCCWRIRSTEMWCCVTGWTAVPNVLKTVMPSSFRPKQCQKSNSRQSNCCLAIWSRGYSTTTLLNAENCTPNVIVLHPSRFEPSVSCRYLHVFVSTIPCRRTGTRGTTSSFSYLSTRWIQVIKSVSTHHLYPYPFNDGGVLNSNYCLLSREVI